MVVVVADRRSRAYRAAKADGGGTQSLDPASWLGKGGATEAVAQDVRETILGQEVRGAALTAVERASGRWMGRLDWLTGRRRGDC